MVPLAKRSKRRLDLLCGFRIAPVLGASISNVCFRVICMCVRLVAPFDRDFRAGALLKRQSVMIAWSPVGNPGNAPDPLVAIDGRSGFGSVNYDYNIGTYDVTNTQYAAFLNSNDPTGSDKLGLYNSFMHNPIYGGINFNSAASAGSKYSAISIAANYPANFVTFYDAIRFANWLNNGQGAR